MRVCDSCREENSDDALVCKECGDKLTAKRRKTMGGSKFYSNKVLLVILVVIIIFGGLYFSNIFTGDTTIEVEDPEILIESVTINEIEKDWLENNTWQVSSTVYFKILNSNDFDINITNINFSVDMIDDGKPVRIYEGFFSGGVVSREGSLTLSESFWFLSGPEGVDDLSKDDLQFTVNGIAVFLVETLSSYQEGFVEFTGEV